VQAGTPEHGDGIQHRLSHQLMSKREQPALRDEHASSQAFVGSVRVLRGRAFEEPRFDTRADHGRDIEHRLRRGREPRDAPEDRVADRQRQLEIAAQDLGHEEWIATGASVQGRHIDRPRADEQADCLFAQRWEGQPKACPGCNQVAEHGSQRVIGDELVVTVSEHQEHVGAANSSPEEAQEVERGFVGPMDVLDDDDARVALLSMGASPPTDFDHNGARLCRWGMAAGMLSARRAAVAGPRKIAHSRKFVSIR
jgi:hypothetical protein